MDTGLRGRSVIVTGATANIGRGVALAFAAEGARVAVVGRDEDAGRRVVARARETGAEDAFWRSTDVTDAEQARGLVADVVDRFGGLDVVVNGVGGNADIVPFVESDPDTWLDDIRLTLVSTLNVTHAALPTLIAQGSGRIVNIGSTAGFIGDRYLAVYSAAKGGVHAFTRVLALEVGKSGVTVNAVAPYRTRADDPADAAEGVSAGSRYHASDGVLTRLRQTRPELLGQMLRETAVPRDHARPSEIGAAAVYLASSQAEFVTGQIIAVDGGALLV